MPFIPNWIYNLGIKLPRFSYSLVYNFIIFIVRTKDLDKLKPGDIVVITRESGKITYMHKIGDELIFQNFQKMDIMSASTIYLIRTNDDGVNIQCSFTYGISKYIDTKSNYLRNNRDIKINKILS